MNTVNAEDTQLELEIKQRDIVIEEITQLLLYNFKGHSQPELLNFLQSNPKYKIDPSILKVESNYIFWGTTVKFKFENGMLESVYW
jgi:hypothetical protein